jgi:hypothetical protein
MFSDQGVKKDPRMKKIMEEETEADKDEQDPLEKAVLTIGKMFQDTVVKALGANANPNASGTESTGTTGGSNPGSPQRKKRSARGSPKKPDPKDAARRKRLEELKKKLENDMSTDSEEDEPELEKSAGASPPGTWLNGSGAGAGAGGTTKEELYEKTAEVLNGMLEKAAHVIEAMGRKGDGPKADFQEETPMKDVPLGWVGQGTPTVVEINPSSHENVINFLYGNFHMADAERGMQVYLESVLGETQKWKRSAEVLVAISMSWGMKLTGPRRTKMSSILISLALAKNDRLSAEAGTPGSGAKI